VKIAIAPNLTRENAKIVAESICNELDKIHCEYIISKEHENSFSCTEAEFLQEDEMLEKCDILIAVGGDGTIISWAKKATLHNKPILGVNAGRVAFMAGLEAQELGRLKSLLENNYYIDKRMMLQVEAEGKFHYCINDAVIGRARHINMAEIEVRCDGNLVNNYYADGVIVSTPTGSTAYSLSAGGPVIDPTIESIMVTPICTHSLFSRSLIFRENSVFEVYNRNRNKDEIYLSCDGGESIILPVDSKAVIRKAQMTAEFIRIKEDTFIDTLNSKLILRRA